MKHSAISAVATITLIGALAAGCAGPAATSGVYRARQTGSEQIVRMAVVESVREVLIDRGETGVGTTAGAIVGGVAGSTVGGGRGSAVGTVLGAVAGGLVGQSVERQNNQVRGLEITVRLENGQLRAITQEADEHFRPGDRVRLVSGRGGTRVTH